MRWFAQPVVGLTVLVFSHARELFQRVQLPLGTRDLFTLGFVTRLSFTEGIVSTWQVSLVRL